MVPNLHQTIVYKFNSILSILLEKILIHQIKTVFTIYLIFVSLLLAVRKFSFSLISWSSKKESDRNVKPYACNQLLDITKLTIFHEIGQNDALRAWT